MRPLLPLLLLVSLAACTGGRGHPVRTSLPRLAPGEKPAPPVGLPEPGIPEGDAVLPLIFLGEPAIQTALTRLRAAPAPTGRAPRLVALPQVERALLTRYRRKAPAGPVRRVTAIGTTGWVPVPPQRMADLIEDPEVERLVLAANTFEPRGFVYQVEGQSRRRYWVEMLKVGAGPFRYDLKFGIHSERWTLPDGRIVIRFDPMLRPRPQIVTMYRGGVILEPQGEGTRITEVLAFGNSLQVPPPIWKLLRPMIETTQKNRSINLWKRAWWEAAPKAPR
ncbi:MAG: hypothetical protein QNJ98_02705 [Planctomycetota bacterium]|nr:hypothetical protein [Planctomycetota bacterium]